MQLYGIKTPVIKEGDDIVKILISSINDACITPEKNDILVLAESAVATAEGRIVELGTIEPGEKAKDLSLKYNVEPGKMELIIRESSEIIGGLDGVVVTITGGVLSPNAGIDESNAPVGYEVLVPEDPKRSAVIIREKLIKHYGCDLGVIIGDSRTQPLRFGCVGIALGCAGIEPVEDVRGKKDLFGKTLLITRRAIADNLVSAAQIIMGEGDECTPCVLIRDAPVNFIKGSSDIPQISKEECLYFGCFEKLRRH